MKRKKYLHLTPQKTLIPFFLSLLFFSSLSAQSIRLDSCRQWARDNYPLIRQFDLIDKLEKFNIRNANKSYLPQVAISARATYQSDVTNIEIPEQLQSMFTLEKLSNDQYQALMEVTQLIWDGGLTASKKKTDCAQSNIDRQKIEVELYKVNDQVNQLFFGVLLLNEQEKQLQMLIDELQSNYGRIEVYVKNGVANDADLDAIKVEMLDVKQKITQLISVRKSYLQMLSLLTGKNMEEHSDLQKPVIEYVVLKENSRPEIALFDIQTKYFDSQRSMLNASNMPRVGAFLQAGYGRPGLNMLSNDFAPLFVGGISLKWNLSSFYTRNDDLRKIKIGQQSVDVQKETFLFNTSMLTQQQQNDIDKLQKLIEDDDEIIRLRENIKKTSKVKVDNGTLTVIDLIRDINAENQARQNKSMHEIQLLQSIYNYKYTLGQ